ncbi:MAG: glycoside hydrolase family 13 protein [Clostridiales bacterium]|nr:glycoside hydrolase family 13 protein [Clostridiales bacterium]
MIEYCPLYSRFKSRVGGVKAGHPLTVNILGEAHSATLVLTKEGEGHVPVYYDMDRFNDGFTVNLNITTCGLYFYYFLIDGVRYGSDEFLNLIVNGSDYLQLVYEGSFRPLSGGVIYQIMPDRFYIEGKPNIKTGAKFQEDWYAVPSHLPDESGKYNNEFFGGNLQGIISKLDYLKDLGVTYIYLNPIFEAASSHRYDTGDYEKIDSTLGTEEDFDSLVLEAKKRGIGIILDGVFSHTGADSKYFNRYGNYDTLGAYQSQSSLYYEWYSFNRYPNEYKCWWGFETLPEVNEASPSYMDFMLGSNGVIERWGRKGIVGWRLDVADELHSAFLDRLHSDTNVTLIGEVWENAARKFAYGSRRSYFLGKQLDGVTNYPFKAGIIEFLLTGDNTLLRKTLRELINDYPSEVFLSMMNILGTHDTDRIITALSNDERPQSKDERAEYTQSDIIEAAQRVKLASLIQYILPGVPCLYYGDEAGLSGHEDPFCRKCYPWGNENAELIAHYKRLGEIRRQYASVFSGSCTDESPSNNVFKIVRSDGDISLTLIVNLSGEDICEEGAFIPDNEAILVVKNVNKSQIFIYRHFCGDNK